MPDDQYIPPVVSIKQMADLLGVSRSRLYQLLETGFLVKPVYLLSNRRPYFTQTMAKTNLQVKREGVGINGQIVLFYAKREKIQDTPVKRNRRQKKSKPKIAKNEYADLKDALESLGLNDLTDHQIKSALVNCFPDSIADLDESEVITTVFRYLNQKNSADNVR
jgi:hypothetical protein